MSRRTFLLMLFAVLAALSIVELVIRRQRVKETTRPLGQIAPQDSVWIAPDTSRIPVSEEGSLVRYGRMLISNTAYYLGPRGKVAHISNGMNCQNCHLDAGTKPFGNNYGGVFSTYPKFRERRGAVETIVQRINDCFQRSLGGSELDSTGHEMQAILAYIKWVGYNVSRGKKPYGSGIWQPQYLDRAADSARGEVVYANKCSKCHGPEGRGLMNPDSTTYLYPPLWGDNSYNSGAGLFRLSRFAGYVRDNMPLGASYKNRQLSEEEAWDVAAYVNSKPRPRKTFRHDWPNIALKPVDHPFGPYSDSFPELQHRLGPFKPIQLVREASLKKKSS
ncbi:MAG TPA: c-type cytochrome [Puia sp.]|nr:c-type cytochrome [Puia sp.]